MLTKAQLIKPLLHHLTDNNKRRNLQHGDKLLVTTLLIQPPLLVYRFSILVVLHLRVTVV